MIVPIVVMVEQKEEHDDRDGDRSEEHTSELQSRLHLVCRLLLEKKQYPRFKISRRDSYSRGGHQPKASQHRNMT